MVDAGNRRVLAILPDGTIVTVAGGGRLPGHSIPSGTPATDLSLYPGDVAIDPLGELDLSARSEVLRLTSSGLLDEVAGPASVVGVVSTYAGSCSPGAIAFDRSGRLCVGCDRSREPLVRNPDGRFAVVTHLYRPHHFPGLAAAPDGIAVAPDGTIYTDSLFGDGFTHGPAPAEVGSTSTTRVLASGKERCRQLPR
ncbi:MAG: hypothetical protein M0Z33_04275 [Actinomycetota bacterium]|nr:hypothetical protein [Actinomycetota bacterium]